MKRESSQIASQLAPENLGGRKASILLVDDNEGNLEALEVILNELDQELVRARSGQEALRLLLKQDFAVILLDVRMPDMDGFETADLIRKRQRSRHTPIIFITAADSTSDQIARGYSTGAVDFIFKPFIPEVLKAKVRIFLDLFNKSEEMRESEARLRTLIANAPGTVYRREATPPWEMIYLSDPIEKLTGYAASNFLDGRRSFAIIIHPEDVKAISAALETAAQKKASYELEYRIVHRDGGVRWVFDKGRYVIANGAGHMDGLLLEITDRKAAEEAISELLGRLLQTQDEERRRISRELHDSTSPLLTSLITKLYTVRHRDRNPNPGISSLLDESLKLAEDTSNVIRNVSQVLHPRLLDENGLLAGLRWFVTGFTTRTGIGVEMNFPEDLARLSREAEITLFRVVQESLTNVLRHSGSKAAKIRVSVHGRELMLEVSDQGRGVTPGALNRLNDAAVVLGVGIAGMRERLRQLGGHLEFGSNFRGTTVTAVLPLDAGKN